MTGAELVERARTWLGVPFVHQGRTRAGVDCIGLFEALLREAGALPAGFNEPTNYGRRPSGRLEAALTRWCMPTAQLEPGVLLGIAWPQVKGTSHVALLTGENMIHAYASIGRVCEHGYRGRWVRWTVGAWRLPAVTYVER
jgi:cell wall-associated NlpC family hydrolase